MSTFHEGASEQNVYRLVVACFVLSGFAALLYQAAWLKTLSLYLRHLTFSSSDGACSLYGRDLQSVERSQHGLPPE